MTYRYVNKIAEESTLFFFKCPDLPINRMTDRGFKKVLVGKNLSKADYIVIGTEDIEEIYKIFKGHKEDLVFIKEKDLYKQTCEEVITKEIFFTLNNLLKSNKLDSTRIALELMSKIVWIPKNTFYLAELWNEHNRSIKHFKQNMSTNVKFFLDNFINTDWYWLRGPSLYYDKNLVKTLEQAQYLHEKFLDEIKDEIESLLASHNLSIKSLEFQIELEPEYEAIIPDIKYNYGKMVEKERKGIKDGIVEDLNVV